VNWQLHAKLRGSSPQRVVSHLPNIATLRRGTHFSTCSMVMAPETTSSEWSAVACSASNCLGQHVLFHGICHHHFFATLVHFQGERRVVKKSTLCTLVIMMKKMDGPQVPNYMSWIFFMSWMFEHNLARSLAKYNIQHQKVPHTRLPKTNSFTVQEEVHSGSPPP
jgi:hypothetical protein